MPSLVESLGAELRRIGTELPVSDLARAADRLRAATDHCAAAMHESGHADWLAELVSAGEHLDRALACTAAVLTGLDGYLTGIGLAGVAHPAAAPHAVAAGPTGTGRRDAADPALALRAWWAERVDLLTGRRPEPERPATVRDAGGDRRGSPEEPADALARLSRAARGGDPDGYREQLLATHPASGLQVAAPAARAARYLATDALGHPPAVDDAGAVADRCGARRARVLLPAVDDRLATGLVGQLCGDPAAAGRAHPVDVAATWPVLLAGLLRALGRAEDELPRLTTAQHQHADETVRRDGH